jgi:cell division protein FtsI (penicillin-binding protein 3)
VTRRYSKENYVSTFIGFVPANRPRLVILVMVDEPREQVYGGVVAGPAFKDVGAWALNNLHINPQIRLANIENELPKMIKKSSKAESMPKERTVNKELLPDFTGLSMREVLREITRLGLTIEVEGTGLAFKQDPTPGSSIKKISSIKVSFRPPV